MHIQIPRDPVTSIEYSSVGGSRTECVRIQILSVCSVVLDSFASPCAVACPAFLFMGFSRSVYWSVLPFSPAGDLPDPGIETVSPASPASAGGFFTTEPPGKPRTESLYFLKKKANKLRYQMKPQVRSRLLVQVERPGNRAQLIL